jgi:hypothetical protein
MTRVVGFRHFGPIQAKTARQRDHPCGRDATDRIGGARDPGNRTRNKVASSCLIEKINYLVDLPNRPPRAMLHCNMNPAQRDDPMGRP